MTKKKTNKNIKFPTVPDFVCNFNFSFLAATREWKFYQSKVCQVKNSYEVEQRLLEFDNIFFSVLTKILSLEILYLVLRLEITFLLNIKNCRYEKLLGKKKKLIYLDDMYWISNDSNFLIKKLIVNIE